MKCRLTGKDPDVGRKREKKEKIKKERKERKREKRAAEDEMVG